MPAVAIKDHGSVVGYGEAFRYGQQYKDMKIIYGVEAYVVDDTLRAFLFLGEEKAWEIVVENTNMIADQIEPFPIF